MCISASAHANYICEKDYVVESEAGVVKSDVCPFNHNKCTYIISSELLYPGQKVQICFQIRPSRPEGLDESCPDSIEVDGVRYREGNVPCHPFCTG